MLHHARAIQPKHIRHSLLTARNIQMHESNPVFKRLVRNGPIHARNQILEEFDGGCAALGRVGGVVDVVWGDVGEVGGLGVFEDVEFVNEVVEDGVLLAGAGGLRGTVGPFGDAGIVIWIRGWGGEDGGEGGEEERDDGGEMHVCVVGGGECD